MRVGPWPSTSRIDPEGWHPPTSATGCGSQSGTHGPTPTCEQVYAHTTATDVEGLMPSDSGKSASIPIRPSAPGEPRTAFAICGMAAERLAVQIPA
eukprot:scaffold92413_cov31-Tisochrysis_lutea.AAC.2